MRRWVGVLRPLRCLTGNSRQGFEAQVAQEAGIGEVSIRALGIKLQESQDVGQVCVRDVAEKISGFACCAAGEGRGAGSA